MSIKRKILLFSSIALVCILLLINGSIFVLFQKILYDNELRRVSEQTLAIVEATNQTVAQANEGDLRTLLRAYLPPNGMIRIITEETTSLLTIAKEGAMQQLPSAFQRQQAAEIRTFAEIPYAVVSFPIIWIDGSIVMLEVTERLEAVKNTVNTLLMVLLLATAIVLIPAFIFGNALSRLIITPIKQLTETMKEIRATGAYKKITLTTSSQDELYEMGATFNEMIDLLEKNYQKQQQFVSDASHELKTPLTVIESYARMLKRWGMKKQDILEESVEAIYSEAMRMKAMTEQMLQLANEDSQLLIERKEVDLLAIAQQASQHISLSFQREISMIEEGRSFRIWADENKIKQVVYILLDNARKYSEAPININLSEADKTCSLTVTDQGIGIPSEEAEKIFDRFYRVDKARTRESGGTGLGLSIAKKIVEAHQGTITLTSAEGKGTSVTITLPKWRKVNEE